MSARADILTLATREVGVDEDVIQATYAIFLEGHDLMSRWRALPVDESRTFVMAECGFGAGLATLLACKAFQESAPASARLHVFSAEEHPFSLSDLSLILAQYSTLRPQVEALLASYPTVLTPGFHTCILEEGRIVLTLMLGDSASSLQSLLVCGDEALELQLRKWAVDAWFLHKGVKNASFYANMALLSHEKTTVVSSNTHAAEGLKAAGFHVEMKSGWLKGAFGRRMNHRMTRETPWHVSTDASAGEKHAIVLGAGLAGCFTASALAKLGWRVTLVDGASQVGLGASGNPRAVLYPILSAFDSPLSTFMLSAFLFATRIYKALLVEDKIKASFNGVLQLAPNEKTRKQWDNLQSWLAHYPELGRWVSAREASELAGISVHGDGLFLPQAGWVDSQALCEYLAHTPNVTCVLNRPISALHYDAGLWHAGDVQAPVLVVASGYQSAAFDQTNHLPFYAFRGQMTQVLSGEKGRELKIPVCASGHILPAQDGAHWMGATYQPECLDVSCLTADDEENMHKLSALNMAQVWEPEVTGHWAGVRAVTPDYLPFVGPVANPAAFNQRFHALNVHARQFIPLPGTYQPGLYVCAGFGSRGLASIPLCAAYLAATITGQPFGMSRAMMQSLAPARFLRRALTRAG